MNERFWLVTTQKLENDLWFRDEEDFKVGMNYVAVLVATLPIEILAFVLMSNHVHFVLMGLYKESLSFINLFKQLYSRYFSLRYSSRELLRENTVDFRELAVGDESLERAIAYVQMNPVAANICLNPAGYPWGTGSSFFNSVKVKGTRAGDLSRRALARLVHSKVIPPSDYVFDDRGVIIPGSYLKVEFVERIFRTPNRMNFFLNNSSKAKFLKEAPSFEDQLILPAIRSLCVSLFRRQSFKELSVTQQAEILKQIRYRFSSDPNQLARLVGLSYEEVSNLLDSV